MRGWFICFFTILFVCSSAKAQQLTAGNTDTTKNAFSKNVFAFTTTVNPLINKTVETVPGSYYTNTLGFFCKKELQLEKALKFPVKFRLGSVAYTDQMEGKKTATSLYK